MKTKLLAESGGLRTFAVVFASGDDPLAGLHSFAVEQAISGAQLSAIGAFERLTVGYFDWPRKRYHELAIDEQVEVLTLTGNIGRAQGAPKLHAHLVVGKADGSAHGGHLLEARVRPTLEVMVTETPRHLRRVFDPETGLALIDLDAKGEERG